ncbi:MAG: tRNA (adenosine(37)-N6)-threonylcarbamoyltransferase complex ATPase subunit type 1 TsaE [Gammaproteobacteria bacterium CG11_big_fil_rev_8_21_14_0_20_46_22]|nr:MAG: tRNA (adenosine(37)-N6)-threonylcarbamoyltransferase complex ATPase subunit type 1 TsaE [Gammaproteobacteria bacterium CG12_big_fil_rev_8_21_14_0_65_46_12]PIR12050.1 MAG: tRNA (adenosine(37)-N6)-threonylcarbamoyltransferase complex ATPase subunit type 1 TsaE [Gammaproteobacteria bacterium CG11_big_fil_rev_8_21_14_0_20_46_22]
MRLMKINDELALQGFCRTLFALLPKDFTLYLHGDLGAGKTTFSRYLIQAASPDTKVKSPTYTLVEPYNIGGRLFYHFDLYRLSSPDELYALDVDDIFSTPSVRLVEWPSQAQDGLPSPDLDVYIEIETDQSRRMRLEARSDKGIKVLNQL